MAYTTINKSSLYFNTKLYTGNATDDTAITGVGFTPSFLWGKNRTDAGTNHFLIDAVRGVTKELNSNNDSVDGTDATLIKSFDSDGFTLGDGSLNQSAKNFVTWNWKANGQGSPNTDGSINTTYTSADTTSGFSISKFTGTGSTATVGHGLGVAPKLIIAKALGTTSSWWVYHASVNSTNTDGYLVLNSTAGTADDATIWTTTAPTSSVFSIGSAISAHDYVAYCFAEKTGYSKFGSYTGNGNANGPFVYTGFKPAFIMIKRTDTTADWIMKDNKRPTVQNPVTSLLYPNTSGAEATGVNDADFLSNGYKIRTTGTAENASGGTYIYMAFAEAPLVGTNNVPAVAK